MKKILFAAAFVTAFTFSACSENTTESTEHHEGMHQEEAHHEEMHDEEAPHAEPHHEEVAH